MNAVSFLALSLIGSSQPERLAKTSASALFGAGPDRAASRALIARTDPTRLAANLKEAVHSSPVNSPERMGALFELAIHNVGFRNHMWLLNGEAGTNTELAAKLPGAIRRYAVETPTLLSVRALFCLTYSEGSGGSKPLSPWGDQLAFFLAKPVDTLNAVAIDEHARAGNQGMWYRLYEAITEEDFMLKRSDRTIERLMRSRDASIRNLATHLYKEVDPRHNVP